MAINEAMTRFIWEKYQNWYVEIPKEPSFNKYDKVKEYIERLEHILNEIKTIHSYLQEDLPKLKKAGFRAVAIQTFKLSNDVLKLDFDYRSRMLILYITIPTNHNTDILTALEMAIEYVKILLENAKEKERELREAGLIED